MNFNVAKTSDAKLTKNLTSKGWTKRDAERAVRIVRKEGINAAAKFFGMKRSTFWVQLSAYSYSAYDNAPEEEPRSISLSDLRKRLALLSNAIAHLQQKRLSA